MPNKVFIHIGLAKTGTKSIQLRLAANRQQLKRRGFHYPYAFTATGREGHHCLAWVTGGLKRLEPMCAGFDLNVFRREVEGSEDVNILVSSEELSLLSFSYANIRKLLQLFPAHLPHVVAYVREQAEFFNSFYLEIVSDFINPGPFQDYVAARRQEPRYDYRLLFNIWRDLLGDKLIVRPYDRAAMKDGDVVEDFKASVGLDAHLPVGEDKHQNVAFNSVQTAVMLHLIEDSQRRFGTDQINAHNRRLLKKAAYKVMNLPELASNARFWPYEADTLQGIREQYRDSNSDFFKMHGLAGFEFEHRNHTTTIVNFHDLDPRTRHLVDELWAAETAPLKSVEHH